MDRTALQSIEQGILNDENIASLLRKVIIFSAQVDSTELRDWAMRELRGYPDVDAVPRYRLIDAPLAVDAIVGNAHIQRQNLERWEAQQALNQSELDFTIPDRLPLQQPIAEIQALLENGAENRMQPGWGSVAGRVFDRGQMFQNTLSVYYRISSAALRGVIDQVSTELANFVSELRLNMSDGQQEPTPTAVSNAVHVTINGGNNNFTTGADSPARQVNVNIPVGDRAALDDALAQLGVPQGEVSTLDEALASGEDPRAPGSAVTRWVDRARSGAWTGAGKVTTGALGGLAARAVASFLGWN